MYKVNRRPKKSNEYYYEIIGKGSIGDKEFAISVILSESKKDDVLYISIFSKEIKENRKPRSSRPLRKSALLANAVVIPCVEAVELPVLFQPAFGTATCDTRTIVIIVARIRKKSSVAERKNRKK